MQRILICLIASSALLIACTGDDTTNTGGDTSTATDTASDSTSTDASDTSAGDTSGDDTPGDDATGDTSEGCETNEDCAEGAFCNPETGECVEASCSDGEQNGTETDVDCGGTCIACTDGQGCAVATDCTSASCSEGVCVEATCEDGIQNGFESDVDCGAGCESCTLGQGCFEGPDCVSGTCTEGVCTEETCEDSTLNNGESDVDCGGPNCEPCPGGSACESAGDCASINCVSDVCAEASCQDGLQNGDETYIDCGGSCEGCASGDFCNVGDDCASQICDNNACVAAGCTDDVQNGTETDVDCGGPDCASCAPGAACSVGTDCTSGGCTDGICDDFPRNCAEIQAGRNAGTGTYTIDPDTKDGPEPTTGIYCNMDVAEGGWTLISAYQRLGTLITAGNYCGRPFVRRRLCQGHLSTAQVDVVKEVLIYDMSSNLWFTITGFDNLNRGSLLNYLAGTNAIPSGGCKGCDVITDKELRVSQASHPLYYNTPLYSSFLFNGWRLQTAGPYLGTRYSNLVTMHESETAMYRLLFELRNYPASNGPIAIYYR